MGSLETNMENKMKLINKTKKKVNRIAIENKIDAGSYFGSKCIVIDYDLIAIQKKNHGL
jgi:hypothetical protein